MLSDIAIRKAKPRAKPYKLADGYGLYLEVFPNGSKLWRLKYRRPDGKETRISLGRYPDVPAPKARRDRDALTARRRQEGIDPAAERRIERLRSKQAAGETFEALAREWLGNHAAKWSAKRVTKITSRLTRDVFPWIGARPVSELKAAEILTLLKRIESRGAVDTAHRARQEIGMVMRFAVASGRAESDVSAALKGALKPRKVRHFAALVDEKAVGGLIRAVRTYPGTPMVRTALQLAPLLFVRPGELRAAEWSEFDLDAAEWRIPAAKMKMGMPHIVPLSAQAVALLRELQPLTGVRQHVFPGVHDPKRPMSENTVLFGLRRLGYTPEQMTGHGFRAMARTRLAEMGWNPDAIERQLAHKPSGALGATYDRAQFLGERRKMMQAWADYLDRLAIESNVVAGNFGKAA